MASAPSGPASSARGAAGGGLSHRGAQAARPPADPRPAATPPPPVEQLPAPPSPPRPARGATEEPSEGRAADCRRCHCGRGSAPSSVCLKIGACGSQTGGSDRVQGRPLCASRRGRPGVPCCAGGAVSSGSPRGDSPPGVRAPKRGLCCCA